MGVQLGFKIKH